jgi:hypothetical protein
MLDAWKMRDLHSAFRPIRLRDRVVSLVSQPRGNWRTYISARENLAEAETLLLQSLEIDDKQVQRRVELGKIYQRQGKLSEAEALLLKSRNRHFYKSAFID